MDDTTLEIMKTHREKYWHELTDTEKIERLALRVEYMKKAMDDIAETTEKMLRHVHVEGRIFYGEGNVYNELGWPNENILFRERPER